MFCSFSSGKFVCKTARLSNSPVTVSSTPVPARGYSCCCWWLSICSALPVYGREAEREHRPHLLHWYLLSFRICEKGWGGVKNPVPSLCFTTGRYTHLHARTQMHKHTLKGCKWERGSGMRQMDEQKKVPFIWAWVKLRFNLMWLGWKTAGVSDNQCVHCVVCCCLIFHSQLQCSSSLFSKGNETMKISLRELLCWKQPQRVVRSSLSWQCYCLVNAETNSSVTPARICPDMW